MWQVLKVNIMLGKHTIWTSWNNGLVPLRRLIYRVKNDSQRFVLLWLNKGTPLIINGYKVNHLFGCLYSHFLLFLKGTKSNFHLLIKTVYINLHKYLLVTCINKPTFQECVLCCYFYLWCPCAEEEQQTGATIVLTRRVAGEDDILRSKTKRTKSNSKKASKYWSALLPS